MIKKQNLAVLYPLDRNMNSPWYIQYPNPTGGKPLKKYGKLNRLSDPAERLIEAEVMIKSINKHLSTSIFSNMKHPENHRFKNEATRRFHDYFYGLVRLSDVDKKKVYAAFGLEGTKNPSQFFNKLRSGAASVTVNHVYIAKEQFDMNPGYWFGVSNQQQLGFESMLLQEPNENISYSPPRKDNRKIGAALHEIFRRRGTEIKGYARSRLKMTEQNLHKIFRGEITPNWWLVVQICEDHGESLEQFRTGPIPEGHFLGKIKLLEERVIKQSETIRLLKDQLDRNQGKERRASA